MPSQDDTVIGTQDMADLAERAAHQHERLTGPPIPVDFTYDRNGLRLGIAALEDELRELYDEWAAGKKNLDDAAVAAKLRHEALDVAAVAMLIYRNVPDLPEDPQSEDGWTPDTSRGFPPGAAYEIGRDLLKKPSLADALRDSLS